MDKYTRLSSSFKPEVYTSGSLYSSVSFSDCGLAEKSGTYLYANILLLLVVR